MCENIHVDSHAPNICLCVCVLWKVNNVILTHRREKYLGHQSRSCWFEPESVHWEPMTPAGSNKKDLQISWNRVLLWVRNDRYFKMTVHFKIIVKIFERIEEIICYQSYQWISPLCVYCVNNIRLRYFWSGAAAILFSVL